MTVIYVYGNVKFYILDEIDILELIKIEKKIVYRNIEDISIVIFSRLLDVVLNILNRPLINNIIVDLFPQFPLAES